MPKQKITGKCHLCGIEGQLSFEHIPPKAAFNNRRVDMAHGDQILKSLDKMDFDDLETKIHQKGSGDYTLCIKCNNKTGRWYGRAYVSWVYQAASILNFTANNPTLEYPYRIFPLHVIKQIICMFFSANGPEFRNEHADLANFVLDKQRKYFDPKIKILAYYNPTIVSRQSGISAVLRELFKVELISEISYFPFGYVMLFDETNFLNHLTDISFFSRYTYTSWKEFFMKFPTHEIYTWFPGDFRDRKTVLDGVKQYRKSKANKSIKGN